MYILKVDSKYFYEPKSKLKIVKIKINAYKKEYFKILRIADKLFVNLSFAMIQSLIKSLKNRHEIKQ